MTKTTVLKNLRKRKYTSAMCDTIVEIASNGGHLAEMCLAIGVSSTSTFYRWCDDYKEFSEAYKTSKLVSQAYHERLLRDMAQGKIPNANFSALAMTMNNKFPTEYKRGTHGNSGTEINIGSINSIERLDSDTLDKKIEALNSKLGLLSDGQED